VSPKLIDGLILYLGLVVLLTFHEFGHAWMAHICGDDTAKSQGRVSLNPIVHIDPIGTVLLPLLMIYFSLNGSWVGNFLVGWARPVPVNPNNLRSPRVDEILVTLAGPWMNVLLAIVLMGLARAGLLVHAPSMAGFCSNLAFVSLLLCFFNLIPIPPLDGSQIVRSLIGMSYEVYHQFARYGILILILVLNVVPWVRETLYAVTLKSWVAIGQWFGVSMPVF
jgi:Zn-dependent protease